MRSSYSNKSQSLAQRGPQGLQARKELFTRPVGTLKGVGSRISERLARLGVFRLGDLLCLLPQRYEDRTQLQPIGALRPGTKALIRGRVEIAEVAVRRRRSLLVRVTDDTGGITLRFFHFSSSQQQRLRQGTRLWCFGEVRVGPTGLEMVHPDYTLIEAETAPLEATLTPVYPSTEGLHQQRLRQLVGQALTLMEREPPEDYLADQLRGEWPSIDEALESLHRPPPDADTATLATGGSRWQLRLALEELVAHRLSLKTLSAGDRATAAIPMLETRAMAARFAHRLPFALTNAQNRVLGEICEDLQQHEPMQRLVQGDVGSGKTVVAAAAAVVAAENGYQATLMAPTELLAEQHYANFCRWLEPHGLTAVYLSGALTARERAACYAQIANGAAKIVIGTHALFQEAVEFESLALVIVDEQHRFGVEQRLSLQQKGRRGNVAPHQLIMTATPIPRTLAMTVYADLDCSTIDELPAGRSPIKTVVMPERRRPELVRRLAAHCRGGLQAYWVCPLIDESETLESSAAAERARELKEALPDIGIGLVHGRMKASDKDTAMRRFKSGEIRILVATTVVEVGVDVPEATLMIIENAERMGLAQLHQLRGRVGRGDLASSCILLYKPPLSDIAHRRLKVIRETNDGFAIAQTDLELRGPGEVLGTKQTGAMRLQVADLARDAGLLPEVIRISDELLAAHPEKVQALVRRWVRGAEEYARV
jgi:ATP-dependent DNA helicase RecG